MAFEKAKVIKAAEKFLSQGKINAAIKEYRQIIQHDHDDLTALNMLGDLLARAGEKQESTLDSNPGEVWEENEMWIDLSWRIDPDGSLGIRQFVESKKNPGTRLSVDEYYEWMFDNSVPGLPAKTRMDVGRQERPGEVAEMLYAVDVRQCAGDQKLGHGISPSCRVRT